MDKFEDFSKKIGLNDKQKKAMEDYIKEVIKENLLLMKDEYNNEIDLVINSLADKE
jgi:hypothetical protein